MFVRSLLLIVTSLLALNATAGTFAQDLSDTITAIKSVYQSEYAPAGWKKKYFGYDLNTEVAKAQASIAAAPDMTVQQSRQILNDFVYSTRDYHTSISFVSTESATLPFQVDGVGDHYYLIDIDREKLPESTFPFHVGDEVVSIGGQATAALVHDLQYSNIINTEATDRALAARYVTKRYGSKGDIVPSGPVEIVVQPKGASTTAAMQLIWDYSPELITPRQNFSMNLGESALSKSSILHPMMISPRLDATATPNPYQIGGRKTFTPDLGTQVWASDDANTFYAYTYMTADRKLIGYLRLPSYVPQDAAKAVADFAKIIALFEKTTDSMVIDQVNNPGGSVFYLYELAAMLTDRPLIAPRHRMTVTQGDVAECLKEIEKLKDVKNDADAQKAIPASDADGYPVSYEFARFELSYAKFIVSEWTAGRRLTNPYWIGGVDHINPAPTHYTKPILLLVNHLDFSGGDFFPTIMQDNKRVTVMGSRTAGAGGYIMSIEPPNNVGIASFSVTGSIAERVDGNPIENLGVTPDIAYEMTAEDYTNNYAPYVKAVQDAIHSITP